MSFFAAFLTDFSAFAPPAFLPPPFFPLVALLTVFLTSFETTLLPGDGVIFCTDGLIEAHNPKGEMFGSPRLRKLVGEHSTSGTDLTTFLVQKLEQFTGEGREQEDDITLLTLQRSAPRSSTSG